MSKTKLINLRTGEVHIFRDGDEFTLLNEFGVNEELKVNFALDCAYGPWSLAFADKIAMVFNGAFVQEVGGYYRCLSFRRILPCAQGDINKKLIGKVVAHKPKEVSSALLYGDYAQEIGLASVYYDKPAFTVEFAEGKRTVDADDCFEATKDQQIAYWRQRAMQPTIALSDEASDAARFRWLLDGNGYFMEEQMLCGSAIRASEKDKADARMAIDEAMRGE